MTHDELRQAAVEYLGKAFKSEGAGFPPHLVQAAVSVLCLPDPEPKETPIRLSRLGRP